MHQSIYKIEKVIDEENKIIFLVNPKVASRSLINTMVWDNNYGFKGKIYRENLNELSENFNLFEGFFIFSLFRDPLDRIISCYKDKFFNPSEDDEKWILKSRGLKRNMSFKNFLEFLLSQNGSDEFADRHWISQSKIFNLYGKNFYPHKIWLLDDLDKAMGYLFSKLNIFNKEIVHFNKTPDMNLHIPQEYIKQLKIRYEDDFILYKKLKQNI